MAAYKKVLAKDGISVPDRVRSDYEQKQREHARATETWQKADAALKAAAGEHGRLITLHKAADDDRRKAGKQASAAHGKFQAATAEHARAEDALGELLDPPTADCTRCGQLMPEREPGLCQQCGQPCQEGTGHRDGKIAAARARLECLRLKLRHLEEALAAVTRAADSAEDGAGVLACAILGGAVSRTLGFDLFGFLVVGIISGLGGGIIRDVLLQHGTPIALTDYAYLPTAVAVALIAFVTDISEERWTRLFIVLDAAVLGFWAVAGAQKTLSAGLGWLPAVLLGTLSAIGGGALRDIILGRIPAVFGGNGLYATVAAASATALVICAYADLPVAGIVLGVLLALALRLATVRRGWTLPNSPQWVPPTPMAVYLRLRRTHGSRRRFDET
ncbi:Uncharacterized membrane protein YeiH [Streptomyces sp. LaPpAH-199]|uniref:trimeric intracellular cation channel family protein n=1 Tax=Streptomyces TaxID=1883 RepID=UPI0008829752|nr:TRIC cation channel family protein [Streptomyces sp. LaPpAH-199]SDE35558.1 Uncharacterized membrane protein YeiH [Streptomyces sp. LaPpAH-199]